MEDPHKPDPHGARPVLEYTCQAPCRVHFNGLACFGVGKSPGVDSESKDRSVRNHWELAFRPSVDIGAWGPVHSHSEELWLKLSSRVGRQGLAYIQLARGVYNGGTSHEDEKSGAWSAPHEK